MAEAPVYFNRVVTSREKRERSYGIRARGWRRATGGLAGNVPLNDQWRARSDLRADGKVLEANYD